MEHMIACIYTGIEFSRRIACHSKKFFLWWITADNMLLFGACNWMSAKSQVSKGSQGNDRSYY